MLPLRQLPAIDTLLRDPDLAATITGLGLAQTKAQLRQMQQGWRTAGAAPDWAASVGGYVDALAGRVEQADYVPVFNMTGTLIHTNLGRAPISPAVLANTHAKAAANLTLEFDLATGRRGSRDRPVTDRLAALTGAEAATVVNNNAAAVLLVLNTFAQNKAVPVSRGELVEIGGSFRLPELMQRANCVLREVGTTNRTRIADYANAIDADTGLLMKIHPSNFYIGGFTESVGNRALAALGQEQGVPFCVDLGSGTLVDLADYGLPHEPMPQAALQQGANLVTFSADKLLGGTQAGLIVGDAQLIAALNANPLKRALRCDKLTLVALAETLKLYEDPERLRETLPLLADMTRPTAELTTRAERCAQLLQPKLPQFHVSVADSTCEIGSGALPDQQIPSVAVRITHAEDRALRDLHHALRQLRPAVVGRINAGAVMLDTRSVADWEALLETLSGLPTNGDAATS